MRRGPMSRSRRPSRRPSRRSRGSICALATLALAVASACGGSTTSGFRPGIDGGTPGGGGTNGATGSGGSNGATGGGSGNGTGGASSRGGTGGPTGPLTDGAALGDALPPFDGGTCTDNGGQNTDPNMTAATGTFSGPLAGSVCKGGAFAHVESKPADDGGAPTVTFFIYSSVAGAAAGSLRFQSPADATSGLLDVQIGLPSASPGTYAQAQSCGSGVLGVYLPAPDPSICATDADTFNCPDGCELSAAPPQVCTPILPMQTYAALGADDCFGDPTPPTGSWTLTLTSLTVDPKGLDSSGILNYAAHGSLSATLLDQDPDAGTAGVSLSLTF